jgi:hypothetical protein
MTLEWQSSDLKSEVLLSLKKEITLLHTISDLNDKEREALTSFSIDDIENLTRLREEAIWQLQKNKIARQELLTALNGDKIPLSAYVAKVNDEQLKSSFTELKSLLSVTHERHLEQHRIATFALNVLSGSMSIIWSGTHTESTVYGKYGALSKTYLPVGERVLGTIKEV